jgi:octaheme c-type cytochrome (tetrathionate reductase family)
MIKFGEDPDIVTATRKCLSCHEDQAMDILESAHWRWEGASPFTVGNENRIDLGKRSELINNSTIALKGNWPGCAVCHIGFGWRDNKFDFSDRTGIDCFVCHDTTGTYKKATSGAGMPDASVDIIKVARNVGKPELTCGTNCHFSGGVNEPLRHGTINPKLLDASRDMDIHMGGDVKEITCRTCHRTRNHRISGRSISTSVVEGTFTCSTCHTNEPHLLTSLLNVHLNKHADHVACQTCHIPLYSKGFKTIIRRDWSGTVNKNTQKENFEIEGERELNNRFGYLSSESDIKPEYHWYNGTVKRYLIGDPIKNEITELNKPVGNIKDHNSKIFPFKVVTGKQISDAVYKVLIPARLKGGYWDHGDWNRAAEQGMGVAGMPFSGEYEFIETVFFYGVNHEVLPKEQALSCTHCHSSLNTEDSCLKCHKAPENLDLSNLISRGINFKKYNRVGNITDYIDFKKLGYEGDPIETGGRFKRLHFRSNADIAGDETLIKVRKLYPDKGQPGK